MSELHPLKTLLNIHLASDTSAVIHLPFVLNTLVPDSLVSSPHLSKWTTRIQSLLHSKEPGGRWAGLALAQKTAILSKTLLLENGQSWVGVALPLLSKNEPPAVLKAAIRLLRTIFTRSYEASEFRRQVVTPNIPKLLATLLPLVAQTNDIELKIVAISALINLIPLYPTLHKSSYPALSNLALRFLDGHPHTPVSSELLSVASRLYCVIHVTGGKVGASNLWRKSLNETLEFGTNALWSLRTTFSGAPANVPIPRNEDPVTSVPLHLDRLRCAVNILDDLLGGSVYRPVQVPLGAVVHFTLQLLRCTNTGKKDGFVDPTTHILETTAVPKIQEFGCSLVVSLAERVDHHLQPYLTQLLNILAVHLETQSTSEHRHVMIQTLQTLLRYYPSSHSSLIATRLMKAVLPSISKILTGSGNASEPGPDASMQSRSKKGKKKAQMYEGDELFTSTRPAIYSTEVDSKILLIALEVVQLLLRDPHLSTSMQSISIRVLISIFLIMNRIPPATLSPNPMLHRDVLTKLHDISTEIASGTSDTLSKSLPLIAYVLVRGKGSMESQRQLDLLLHPRLPPLMRSMPLAETLSLVFSEEPEEEGELRRSLGLYTNQDEIQQQGEDVEMNGPMTPPIQLSATIPAPNVAPSKMVSIPVQSAPVLPQKPGSESPGRKQPVSTPTSAPETAEESLLNSFRSTAIEPPRAQVIQPASKPSQAEASTSVSKAFAYSAPPPLEDEDEDIPPIDIDSDSDVESQGHITS